NRQQEGRGSAQDFVNAPKEGLDRIRRLNNKAISAEGYLFPETYSFPRHTTAQQAVEAMIGRFEQIVIRLKQVLSPEKWPLNLHDTVILASLIESEAAQAYERPIIGSVYLNRLR